MIKAMILAAAALTMSTTTVDAQTMIQKNEIKVENHLMTPEALGLWDASVLPRLHLTASKSFIR